MAVAVRDTEDFHPGPPTELFEDRYQRTNLRNPNYDVAPNGRFLMIGTAQDVETSVVVVTNWFEELKRLVPVD